MCCLPKVNAGGSIPPLRTNLLCCVKKTLTLRKSALPISSTLSQMQRPELISIIEKSKIFENWHWFSYHFNHVVHGRPNVLADSIIEACLECEDKIPGYAQKVISTLASVGGRENHLPDWEQLVQILAELMVVRHVLSKVWEPETQFLSEPSKTKGGKNPEIVLKNSSINLAVEVKAPALFEHQRIRTSNPEQIAARFANQKKISSLVSGDTPITLPRDNPVKDFLVSAQEKFEQFAEEPNFLGVLVVVWDDFIYEPISSLSHPECGLLTSNSFFKNADGESVVFPSVGAVVVLRHLHQIVRACQEEPLVDGIIDPLQYKTETGFPPKALIANESSHQPIDKIQDIFQALPPDLNMGAEYTHKELIWWF